MTKKLLGYGTFSGVLWGRKKKDWKFEQFVGIHPTEAAAKQAYQNRVHHCLSWETRRVYNTSKLNIGSRDYPKFVQASRKFVE